MVDKRGFLNIDVDKRAHVIDDMANNVNGSNTILVAPIYGGLFMTEHLFRNYEINQAKFTTCTYADFTSEWITNVSKKDVKLTDADLNAALGHMWKLQRKMIQEIAYAYVKKHASDYNTWISTGNKQQSCTSLATTLENVGMGDQIGYLTYFQ